MNGKKAKAIRRLAKQEGKFQKEANYKVIQTEKVIYGTGTNGMPTAQRVTRNTLINLSKLEYRQMKKAFKNGEFTI